MPYLNYFPISPVFLRGIAEQFGVPDPELDDPLMRDYNLVFGLLLDWRDHQDPSDLAEAAVALMNLYRTASEAEKFKNPVDNDSAVTQDDIDSHEPPPATATSFLDRLFRKQK